MDPVIVDAVTKFGALGVLIYLLPVLQSIKASLAALADAKRDVLAGLGDAGVQVETPTVRDAVKGVLAYLKSAAVLLAFALIFVGCSCNADVAQGLDDLEHDFGVYRRASIARVESQAELHRELGDAIAAHVAEARRRAGR